MQLKSMLSKFFKQKIKTNDDASKALNTSKCRGFSLIDSMISFLIITIIVAAFAPVVIKKMTHGRDIVLKESSGTQKRCSHECILCKADGTCLLCPLRCDEGFYKDKQGCQCLDCSQAGDENCTGCTKDGDAIACTKCKTGYYLDEETHVCKECEAGYYCPNGITRVPCEKGTYQDGTDPVEERYECNPCPPGTYQDEEGQTTCKLCNGGYYCAVEGMDHRDSCAPGSFSRSEGAKTECTDCYEDEPEGFGGNTYSGTAAATCPLCTTKPNVATCQKEGGAIITCQTGYYHSTSPDVCANCSAGYFMNVSHKCQKCTEGSTPDNNTLTQCLSCGEHCADCDISTLQCRACDGGYALDPSTHRCKVPCVPGTYFDGSTCKDCPAGTYSSTSDATECTPCPAGKYSSEGATSCSNCSAGTYSSSGSSTCSECQDGYYQNVAGQSECISCNVVLKHCGKCNKTTGECEECEKPWFLVNNTSCYRCRSGSEYSSKKDICITTRNVGDDQTNLPWPAGINHGANSSKKIKDNDIYCWTGINTASNYTSVNSYSGQNRTVCTWNAGYAYCAAYGGRITSIENTEYMLSNARKKFNICTNLAGITNAAQCKHADTCLSYDGSPTDNRCYAAHYWTSNNHSGVFATFFKEITNNSVVKENNYVRLPRSVRCQFEKTNEEQDYGEQDGEEQD